MELDDTAESGERQRQGALGDALRVAVAVEHRYPAILERGRW